MKRAISLAAVAAIAGVAHAQSINSFNQVDLISDVTTSLNGLNLSLNIGANPTFTLGGNTYNITEVWGVWALDDDNDMSGGGTDSAPWNFNSNFASHGGIAGWKAQTPNHGLTATQSRSFTYSSLTGTVEDIGYHVRVSGSLPGGGNTIHIRGPVPEPATIAALGFGVVGLLRRRKKAA